MKIVISNTVTLNGGDFAILESMIAVLKKTYGNNTEFIVYDSHPEVAALYYPHITYRKNLYHKYGSKHLRKVPSIINKIRARFSGTNRLMLAAKLHSNGNKRSATLLLTNEQQIDFNHYASADIIISTGGTYLVENYSLAERIYDYKFTHALKKPLVFFTQSLGPFNKQSNKIGLKDAFNRANLILLRDAASLENLNKIEVDISKARVCADVVFSDADPVLLENAKFKKISAPLRVGISVRYWKFFKGRSRQEGEQKYFKSVAAICEYITLKLGGEVIFISTCQAIKEYHVDDSKAAKDIYQLLADEAKQKVSVNSDFHTPNELKAILRDLDIVISTRMHGAIQSLNVGVPVLPIAYEFKTKELFKKLIPADLILDIDTLEETEAVKVFEKFFFTLPEFQESLFDNVMAQHVSSLKPVEYLKELVC